MEGSTAIYGVTDGLCVCVWVFTLDLRNGVTYEYEICTVNSCDDTLKDDGLIF